MTEYTVHDKCNTHHITAVFKYGQEQEQYRHLRDKSKHCPEAANDTIHYKSRHQISRADTSQESAHGILNCHNEYIVGPVCHPRTYRRDRHIIYSPHNNDKDRDSENTVCNDTVDLIRCGKLFFSFLNRCLYNLLYVSVAFIRHDTFHIIVMLFLDLSSEISYR